MVWATATAVQTSGARKVRYLTTGAKMAPRRTWFTETARRAMVFGTSGRLIPGLTDRVFAIVGGAALADRTFVNTLRNHPGRARYMSQCYDDCSAECCPDEEPCAFHQEIPGAQIPGRPHCWKEGESPNWFCCCDYWCHDEAGGHPCRQQECGGA